MDERTFAILKISYNPLDEQAEGGICGSCFFVNEKEFITAHHCFNDNAFKSNIGYQKVKVLLANSQGSIIYEPQIKRLCSEYDLTIGEIKEKIKFSPINLSIDTYRIGEQVYNLGYPSSMVLKNYSLKIVNTEIKIDKLDLSLEKQEGVICGIKVATVEASDIKFVNRRILILNYSSELGFSGGPLISKASEQIIGFMSLILPQEFDTQRRAVAVPISEIKNLL